MADFVITGFENAGQTLNDGETGYIGPAGELVTSFDAVTGTASGFLDIFGVIRPGVIWSAVDWQGALAVISIGSTGQVSAMQGPVLDLEMTTAARMRNDGLITSNANAIEFTTGDSAANLVLFNAGRILSTAKVIDASPGTGSVQIVNYGEMLGGEETLDFFSVDAAASASFKNFGLLASSGAVAYGGLIAGADRIVNTGVIDGDVKLESGANVYFGARGSVTGQVSAEAGSDRVITGADDDSIRLGGGEDVGRGGDGRDLILGEGGDDLLAGQDGDDTLDGGAGEDLIRGGDGDDELYGGANGDLLLGQLGDDLLIGGVGVDRLVGGRGDDDLRGGGAVDVFVFGRASGNDVIRDFLNGQDLIDLTAFGYRPSDFSSEIAPALRNAGVGSTFLDLTAIGGDGSVLIEGLFIADADVSDFIL